MSSKIIIDTHFDAGNITVLSKEALSDNRHAVCLNIETDNKAEYFQWFYFSANQVRDLTVEYRIENAGKSSYPAGWEGYQVRASYDRENWFTIHTDYQDGVLHFKHAAQSARVYFAYFAPFSYEQHLTLVDSLASIDFVSHDVLGSTVDGRPIDCLKITSPNITEQPKKVAWVIARQHPGETMAEWFMQGMLARLIDESCPVATGLLETYDFYCVPNMNVDGSIRGHLRANAAGVNLNRAWLEPSAQTSPEVYAVRQKMHETGVDIFFDIHGDEAIPHNFLAGSEGVSNYDDAAALREKTFKQIFESVTPAFQTKMGYPIDEPGQADLRVASNYVAEKFACLAMTLEMPFKDANDVPCPRTGWSAESSVQLGADWLQALMRYTRDFSNQ